MATSTTTTVQIIDLVFVLVIALTIASSSAANTNNRRNQDILVAIGEMQKANYFTFVMLINMAPPDLFPSNANFTFLMPNDRTLSTAVIPESDAVNFLLRHSIPSTLLFEHLQRFPTGSMIPTSRPDLMLRVTNHGRRQFFLNNSRLISPNICTIGSSIRCHGIDEVLQAMTTNTLPDNHDPNNVTTTTTTTPPAAAPAPEPSPTTQFDPINPVAIPPPDGSNNSNTAQKLNNNQLVFMCIHVMPFLVLFMLIFY